MTYQEYEEYQQVLVAAVMRQEPFTCVVCQVKRHLPIFPGQIICGPCRRVGMVNKHEPVCVKCNSRFLSNRRSARKCPVCSWNSRRCRSVRDMPTHRMLPA